MDGPFASPGPFEAWDAVAGRDPVTPERARGMRAPRRTISTIRATSLSTRAADVIDYMQMLEVAPICTVAAFPRAHPSSPDRRPLIRSAVE